MEVRDAGGEVDHQNGDRRPDRPKSESEEEKGEDVRRFQAGDAALEVGAEGDGLSVVKMLPQKRARENVAANHEEEENSPVSIAQYPDEEGVTVLDSNWMPSSRHQLAEDMEQNYGCNGDEAQTVDLRNPGSAGDDAAKLQKISLRLRRLGRSH